MSVWDLKLREKEALNNIDEILESDCDDKQTAIDAIVYNFIEDVKASNEPYKNNAIEDFLTEAKRIVLFSDYEIRKPE